MSNRNLVLKKIISHENRVKEAKRVLTYLEKLEEPNINRIRDIKRIINFLEHELDVKKVAIKLADLQMGVHKKN
ncbi:hypothetical protein [Priestia megaterium]|uniref:hypothetical protein n=1 Tax=Priestia megaterium TaxID=1404 RepID=UPI00203C84B7|nr:hypothetical protein [Priestia megaterium]MCM3100254.1 hypothetical protein [Priestia megaterium]